MSVSPLRQSHLYVKTAFCYDCFLLDNLSTLDGFDVSPVTAIIALESGGRETSMIGVSMEGNRRP